MSCSPIKMGNDEFILFIRKNYPNCKISNGDLGKKIWFWLSNNASQAKQTEEDQPCYWGDQGAFIGGKKLPKTATQFEFGVCILPALFNFLKELGETK